MSESIESTFHCGACDNCEEYGEDSVGLCQVVLDKRRIEELEDEVKRTKEACDIFEKNSADACDLENRNHVLRDELDALRLRIPGYIADEREACAIVAELEWAASKLTGGERDTAWRIVEKIRARAK